MLHHVLFCHVVLLISLKWSALAETRNHKLKKQINQNLHASPIICDDCIIHYYPYLVTTLAARKVISFCNQSLPYVLMHERTDILCYAQQPV
jgi:hypothetical protein